MAYPGCCFCNGSHLSCVKPRWQPQRLTFLQFYNPTVMRGRTWWTLSCLNHGHLQTRCLVSTTWKHHLFIYLCSWLRPRLSVFNFELLFQSGRTSATVTFTGLDQELCKWWKTEPSLTRTHTQVASLCHTQTHTPETCKLSVVVSLPLTLSLLQLVHMSSLSLSVFSPAAVPQTRRLIPYFG